ncbi:MAG: thiamine-phosphate kinase [Alphaproteobacteria bacterium]|nr:thiamine-phosphate kinase [Alphaproteobacteria bacterium]
MGGSGIGDEFELIAKYFAPLAKDAPGALGLTDDAAIVDLPPDEQLVVALDALVAGVHFLASDPPGDIARKIVRVNLSDLAAMGARPVGLLLSLVLPQDVTLDWLQEFAQGLKSDVEKFAVPLIGGDTVSSPGPLTLSLTALGAVPTAGALTRAGARPGDGIYVTGTIGDGVLGLEVAQGGLKDLPPAHRDALLARYRKPEPRLEFGVRLVGIGHAAIDVSDGLLADLEHICACSGVGASITAGKVPVSPAAKGVLQLDSGRLVDFLVGGDDYELLFTASPEREAEIHAIGMELGLGVTLIGVITEGGGLEVTDAEALDLSLKRLGFKHFQ